MKKIIYVIQIALFIAALNSCNKEPCLSAFQEKYIALLDSLKLECKDTVSLATIKANALGQDFCFHQGIDGYSLQFGITNKFTTASPEFSTNAVVNDARRGAWLSILNYNKPSYRIIIDFPDFSHGIDTIHYLDSIFAIKTHPIMGIDDIVVNSKDDFVMQELTKAGGGYLPKFKIDFQLSLSEGDNGGIGYNISSIYGEQKNAYLIVIKAEKKEERDGTYYDLELDFNCRLYHFYQNGKEGLWSELKNGKFIGKIKATYR
jgi:hypothetical protein